MQKKEQKPSEKPKIKPIKDSTYIELGRTFTTAPTFLKPKPKKK